jgi:hypothetical protein
MQVGHARPEDGLLCTGVPPTGFLTVDRDRLSGFPAAGGNSFWQVIVVVLLGW